MTRSEWLRRGAAVLAAFLLAACGGGGGSGGGALPIIASPGTGGATPTPAPEPTPTDTSTLVALTGTVVYDAVPNPAGALAYGSTATKPVRGAAVEVLNAASAVLARGTTDANGAYAVSVPPNTSIVVRVRAQMVQGGSGATWDVSVHDNTQSNALYVLDSPAFSSSSAAQVRDLHATSGWGGTAYAGIRAAAPFAVLDTVYASMQKVLAAAPSAAFPALQVFWSVNNTNADGDETLGQIGTSYFARNITSTGARAIYVLGKENVDTDEFDASVIAHEWGHYYQWAFSRDDSPGGGHFDGDILDRRIAFSEGWGNAWSGIALARSNYTDSYGPGQAHVAVDKDLTTGPATDRGWFSESSIDAILWNLNQQLGFAPIQAAMAGGFKTTRAVTSIHPFTAAFKAASPGHAGVLAALLAGQSISAAPDDPFGTAENNAGGVGSALPMYLDAPVGATTAACVTNAAGDDNKLGNFVYLRVHVATAADHRITVWGGGTGTDPDFDVYSGRLIAQADQPGSSETATVGLLAGDNVVALADYNNSGVNTCFSVDIQ